MPDDIMMRLNISTALAVREMLEDLLPESVTEVGAELPYDRRSIPDHVVRPWPSCKILIECFP